MKKPPRQTKKTRAARTWFVRALVSTVERLGAGGRWVEVDNELFDGPVWEGTLDTVAGPMHVSIYPNGIDTNATAFCRFVDSERANKLPLADLNQYSGKWNHHYFGDWTPEHAAIDLEQQLRRVLPQSQAKSA